MGASGQVPSIGWDSIALSLGSLGLVCLIAYLALRLLAARGMGRGGGEAIRVLERRALEPRRSVYLIETAGRCFLIGAADSGLSLLAEVDPKQVSAGRAEPGLPPGRRFADVLARALRTRVPSVQARESHPDPAPGAEPPRAAPGAGTDA